MGNTVPPRASSREREATGRRRGAGTWRSENVVVTEAASPATPSRRMMATARKQGWDDDDDDDDDGGEEETTRAARRPRAGRALRASGDGAAKVLITVKVVMTRKDAEALVALARLKLKAQSARERKARMAQLEGELRAGSCGGASRGARRPMLPPIKEDRFERVTPVV